jgi:uncharacterized protein YuzE
LKTTRYFEQQVLRKRPYILREWCEARPCGAGPARGAGRPYPLLDAGDKAGRGSTAVPAGSNTGRWRDGPQCVLRPQLPRGATMKLHYYPETDSLYIELKSAPGAEVREIVEGLVVDLDINGDVVGFDIDHASQKFDLSKVETISLPLVSAAE